MKKLFLWPALAGLLQAAIPTLQLKPVAIGQFNSPTKVTHAGDGSGRLFIADQRGKIHILAHGAVLPQPFLDLSAKLVSEGTMGDERGLLGLAFHPDYEIAAAAGEGKFYVFYSAPSPNSPGPTNNPVNCRSVLAEYRVSPTNPNLADPLSERILISFDKPQSNHNGGEIAFGPADGLLYFTTGDGGGANDNGFGHTGGGASNPGGVLGNAQDRTILLGKLLRIDPFGSNGVGGQYGIPATNPFVGAGGGIREEIYAYGLRNPWRFSFDSGTNRLFLADVGQGKFEEINLITAGGNYGWRRFEAFADFDSAAPSTGPYIAPVAAYAHPTQAGTTGLLEVGLSITGGYVYRDRGRNGAFAPLPPPNRTGGSPASGSPVSGLLRYGGSRILCPGRPAGNRARASRSSGWASAGDPFHGLGLPDRAAFSGWSAVSCGSIRRSPPVGWLWRV